MLREDAGGLSKKGCVRIAIGSDGVVRRSFELTHQFDGANIAAFSCDIAVKLDEIPSSEF